MISSNSTDYSYDETDFTSSDPLVTTPVSRSKTKSNRTESGDELFSDSYTTDDEGISVSNTPVNVETPLETVREPEEGNAIENSNDKITLKLVPHKFSIFHTTAYIKTVSNFELATMKTVMTNKEWITLFKSMAVPVFTGVFADFLKQLKNFSLKDQINTGKDVFQKMIEKPQFLTNGYNALIKVQQQFKDRQPFKLLGQVVNATRATQLAASFGLVYALNQIVRQPQCTYAKDGSILYRSEWREKRQCFLIVPSTPSGHRYIMKRNNQTGMWDIYKERDSWDDNVSRDIESIRKDILSDITTPLEDESKAFKKTENTKEILRKQHVIDSKSSKNINRLQRNLFPSPQIGLDPKFNPKRNEVVDMTLATDKEAQQLVLQTDLEAEDTEISKEDYLKSIKSKPLLSIPSIWSGFSSFTSQDGVFNFEVKRFGTMNISFLGNARLAYPFSGAFEDYQMHFNGVGEVPRDVYAFASYIARTYNTLPLDFIVIINLVNGNIKNALLLLLCGVKALTGKLGLEGGYQKIKDSLKNFFTPGKK